MELLFLFIVLLVSAQCSVPRSTRIPTTITPHIIETHVNIHSNVLSFHHSEDICQDRSFQRDVIKVIHNCSCREPLQTVVALVSDDSDFEYVPSHINVKRCGGSCSMGLSCVPSMQTEKSFKVRLRNQLTGEMKCGEVQVAEHQKCTCKCTVMEHHCNRTQEFRKDRCGCVCTNTDAMYECENSGRKWNSKSCECE